MKYLKLYEEISLVTKLKNYIGDCFIEYIDSGIIIDFDISNKHYGSFEINFRFDENSKLFIENNDTGKTFKYGYNLDTLHNIRGSKLYVYLQSLIKKLKNKFLKFGVVICREDSFVNSVRWDIFYDVKNEAENTGYNRRTADFIELVYSKLNKKLISDLESLFTNYEDFGFEILFVVYTSCPDVTQYRIYDYNDGYSKSFPFYDRYDVNSFRKNGEIKYRFDVWYNNKATKECVEAAKDILTKLKTHYNIELVYNKLNTNQIILTVKN